MDTHSSSRRLAEHKKRAYFSTRWKIFTESTWHIEKSWLCEPSSLCSSELQKSAWSYISVLMKPRFSQEKAAGALLWLKSVIAFNNYRLLLFLITFKQDISVHTACLLPVGGYLSLNDFVDDSFYFALRSVCFASCEYFVFPTSITRYF